AVMQGVGEDVDLRLVPWNQAAVEPDVLCLLHRAALAADWLPEALRAVNAAARQDRPWRHRTSARSKPESFRASARTRATVRRAPRSDPPESPCAAPPG